MKLDKKSIEINLLLILNYYKITSSSPCKAVIIILKTKFDEIMKNEMGYEYRDKC
jgi:hypothetical protein